MDTIAKSFVIFQSRLKPINKDAENPFFKSQYLSLSGILEIVIPLLSECGLSVSQPMRIDSGVVILQTILRHELGEYLVSEMILPPNPDPQKLGSLITYYKRYQLQAMLGVCSSDDDDDGQAVSNNKPVYSNSLPPSGEVTEQQRKAVWAICKSKNIPDPKLNTFTETSDWIKKQNQK